MPGPITNPQIVDELRRLVDVHGGSLTPEDLVEAARPKKSLLHEQFEWDDTEAGHLWRLHQARNLMRVVVSFETCEPAIACRVMVSLTPDRESGSGYRLTHTVLSEPALRAQLLADARDEMRRFAAKYRKLTELADVFAAMDRHLK